MQRYEKITTISDSLYQVKCPIIFVKGALLKDNKLNKNILQLQFKNLASNICKAVYVSIDCFDVENKEIETVEKRYIDLTLKYKDTFGENVPIELSSELSRKFQISIDKIIFADDLIVEYSGKMCAIEAPDDLKELENLKNQFIREVEKDNRITRCTVKPTVINGLWYCTCGALNHDSNDKCGMCKIDREKLFSLLNTDFLEEQNNEYLRQKEIEENERKLQEEQRLEELRQQEEEKNEKKKKHKKILKCAVILAILLVVLYGLAIKFVVPAIKYSSALKSISNGDFEEGYTILTELGDYQDSSEQILKGKYEQAVKCIETGEYHKGYEIFSELGSYSDSANQIKKGKYKQASEFLEKKQYMSAIRVYVEIKGYLDSEEKLAETRYQYAQHSIDCKEYKMAVDQLEKILNYKDSTNLYQETCYRYAQRCIEDKKYKSAVEYYEKILDFSDAKEKWMEAMDMYIQTHLSSDEFTSARYLEKLIANNYMDAKKLKEMLYELKVSIVINNNPYDYTNNSSKLSKYDKWYFHINVNKGEKNVKYNLKYTVSYPNGEKEIDYVSIKVNETFTWGKYYLYPSQGETGIVTAKVYDESGTLLAEKSVQIN